MNVTPSLPNWKVTTPWCYLAICLIATITLRVVLFAFRAAAVVRGDFPGSEVDQSRSGAAGRADVLTFGQAFRQCFLGFSENKAHADLWLNAIIGFCELAAYPVLLQTGKLEIIGAWLALKTAGSWSGWSVSRTSFNRFLLNNLLELAIAYFLLRRFVEAN